MMTVIMTTIVMMVVMMMMRSANIQLLCGISKMIFILFVLSRPTSVSGLLDQGY